MFPKALLNAFLLALLVSANPVPPVTKVTKLPLTRRLNSVNALSILKRDQARARALVTRDVINQPITNQAIQYTADVGIGSPPTTYSLIVDTGSANTWVGADKSYVPTSTSTQTSDSVRVAYGPGSFSGTEYLDTVTLGSLAITRQSIGVASQSSGFHNVDGILGIGPVDLSQGTLSPDTGSVVPTVTDNAFSQGSINEHMVSISFEPTTQQSEVNGELIWGGTDSSKYTGAVVFVPITTTSPASTYWGIDQSISYGSTTILSNTAGIVDSGSSLIHIATDAFQKYQAATGGTMDSATGLLTISSDQYSNLQSLNFFIGGTTFELTANAQIWPRSLNTAIGGTPGKIYLIVTDLKTNSGAGLDFINGYAFLERFYTVYDTANHRVGFATTPHTDDTTN